jgi:hypothetical protein
MFFPYFKGKNIFSLIKLSKEKSIDLQEAYAFCQVVEMQHLIFLHINH